jgi:hypothetical protein
MPAGSWIVFRGRFSHARYQSLNTYNVGPTHAPMDALDDVGTKPDHGSTKPFLLGGERLVQRRGHERVGRFVSPQYGAVTGPSRTRPGLLCGRYRHNKGANIARCRFPEELVWGDIMGAKRQTPAGLRVATARAVALSDARLVLRRPVWSAGSCDRRYRHAWPQIDARTATTGHPFRPSRAKAKI